MTELSHRSAGWRESGAIWAGKVAGDNAVVSEVFFHHELCDDQGSAFHLSLTERAKFDLYRTLGERQLSLVALIHTHPEQWVDLSPVDEANQLSSRVGFWSLVAPWYGRRPWILAAMGIHVRAHQGWYRLSADESHRRVCLTE